MSKPLSMPRIMRPLFLLLLFALAGLLASPAARAAEPLVADLSDHLIAITTGFTGAQVLLFGATDGPGDVVVVVRGPTGRAIVRRKDRIFGIWLNNASRDFAEVPNFYAVASSRPLDQLLPQPVAEKYNIGLDNLSIRPISDVGSAATADMLKALNRIKIDEALYQPAAGRVTFLGDRLFRVDFHFPANVPTGSYLVEVLLIRDGVIASAQTTPLVVSKIGVGADIFEFAHRHSAAYGIICIVIALLAGWAAHLAFRRV
jgi:uncharacterized protein (TIGR02186 family)